MKTQQKLLALIALVFALVPACAKDGRCGQADQRNTPHPGPEATLRVRQEPPETEQRATSLSDAELDRALEQEDETEAAERASQAEQAREAPVAKQRKSWDVRLDLGQRPASTTRPATGPTSLAPLTRGTTAVAELPRESTVIRAAVLQSSSLKQITVRRDFVEKYKNRVTITTPVRVVHAGNVHAASQDGDQHIAVLADEVNLALFAEIMNAKGEPVVQAMKDAAVHEDIVQVTGAWRLWCEHPGNDPHIQDEPIPPYPNSNPDHVFEIHPVHRAVTAQGSFDLEHTLHPIAGYTLKPASDVKMIYEKLPCRIESDPQTISIFTKKVGYNYVKFIMEIEDVQQFVTLDGRIVRSSILDLQGNKVVGNRRMVFIKDTPPELAVKDLQRGDRLTVIGMPRINLAVVSWRVRESGNRPEILEWGLPYEMVICAVF